MSFEKVYNSIKNGIRVYSLYTNLDDFIDDIEFDINELHVKILDHGLVTYYDYKINDGYCMINFNNILSYNRFVFNQFNKSWFIDKDIAEQQLKKVNDLIDDLKHTMKDDYEQLDNIIKKVNSQKLNYENRYNTIMKEE